MTAEADKDKTEARKYNEAKLASLYEEYYNKIAYYAYVRISKDNRVAVLGSFLLKCV